MVSVSASNLRFFGLLLAALFAGRAVRAQLLPNLGGQRVGISAFTFLKNDISPRSLGMSGATVSQTGDAYSYTINPALLSEVREYAVAASGLTYAGGIQHANASILVPVGEVGTFSGGVNMLLFTNEQVRDEFHPQGTGQTFAAYSMAANLGYSRKLSERFSLGLQGKFINESLAQYSVKTLAVDIGFLYRTDYRNLRFAAALQHFGTNSSLMGTYSPDVLQNGASVNVDGYPAPTVFKMGAQIDAYRSDEHVLTGHLQLNHPNDNAENIRLGLEYSYATLLQLRAGYKLNVYNERVPTAGIGFKYSFGGQRIQADYGWSQSRYLGAYHCVGIALYLQKTKKEDAPQPAP